MLTSVIDYQDFVSTQALGEGSHGRVHKMTNKHTRDVVAVKHVVCMDDEEVTLASILREAAIAMTLRDNTNIIAALDFRPDVAGGDYSLYMECMDGSLDTMESYTLRSNARSIFRQILLGVYAMHKIGIAHRDLKPENILYKREGDGTLRIAIADFGMSRHVGRERKEGALFTGLVATWPYRPPEMEGAAESTEYGLEVDVWSVGAVFFHLSVGCSPISYYSEDGEWLDIAHRYFKEDGVTGVMNLCGVTVEPLLVDLLQQLLRSDPAERPRIEDVLRHPYFSPDGTTLEWSEPVHSYAAPEGRAWDHLGSARPFAVELIRKLCSGFAYGLKTIHDAVRYLDIHMEACAANRSDHVLVGTAAMVLAADLNEIDPPDLPSIAEYLNSSNDGGNLVTLDDIVRTVFEVLKSADHRLLEPISFGDIPKYQGQ